MAERRGTFRGCLAALCVCAAAGVWAAESNPVVVDFGDAPRFVTENTLRFPIDWESGIVPNGATRAVLLVTGNHYDLRAEVTKPAKEIAVKLFDESPGPLRNDTLRVSLTFTSDDKEIVNSAFAVTYELRCGSFGRDRVLTVDETDNSWRIYRPPVDIPFDAAWVGGAVPSYAALSNCVSGVYYAPIEPFDGAELPRGVLALDRAKYGPGSRIELKIWRWNERLKDVVLDGKRGGFVIVK